MVILCFKGEHVIPFCSDEETLNDTTDELVLLKNVMLRARDVEYVFTAPITVFRLQ